LKVFFPLLTLILLGMHKTNSQFREKYDIESFKHTTVLTSTLHNVYQSMQICKTVYFFVYSWIYSCSYSFSYSTK